MALQLNNNTTNTTKTLQKQETISKMCLCDSLFSCFRRRAQAAAIAPEERSRKRHVRFDKVEIREHALVLGDHPLCRDGLSLELDWKHARKTKVVSIREMMEWQRSRPRIRSKTMEERHELLHRVGGYTQKELQLAQEEAQVKLDDLVEH